MFTRQLVFFGRKAQTPQKKEEEKKKAVLLLWSHTYVRVSRRRKFQVVLTVELLCKGCDLMGMYAQVQYIKESLGWLLPQINNKKNNFIIKWGDIVIDLGDSGGCSFITR